MDGEQRSFHLRFSAGFISPCPRPPLTDSLATAALLGLEMLQQGGGMENVGNSSVSLISHISVERQPRSSPSPTKDDGVHVERSFSPDPRSIQLLFPVYFYAVYLHEPQANTSPSSSSRSGRFIGKSNQVSRGKSFLNVSAKQRARLNWSGYKKGQESHLLFSSLLFLDSAVISALLRLQSPNKPQ